MKGYVYIIQDENYKFYVGSTSDIKRRFFQHQQGHTQTTKNMRNICLVFVQEFESLGTARNLERRIKRLKRKDYIQKIIEDGYIKMKI